MSIDVFCFCFWHHLVLLLEVSQLRHDSLPESLERSFPSHSFGSPKALVTEKLQHFSAFGVYALHDIDDIGCTAHSDRAMTFVLSHS
jgi:hypothetical protein